jgi:hypothetical protein
MSLTKRCIEIRRDVCLIYACLCVKLQLKELIIFQKPDVDPIINHHALKSQKEKVTEQSCKDNPI